MKLFKFTKRIVTAVLSFALVLQCTVTAAENGNTAIKYDKEEKTDIIAPRYRDDEGFPVFSGYRPSYKHEYDSYQYNLFMDILETYTETHLYEFSKEEVTEAFLMKLLYENPELAKYYIHTLLGTMDDYSAYYEFGQGIAGDGASLGYGVLLSDETNYAIRKMGITKPGVYIAGVVKDSNAYLAGIRSGDRVVSVEGVPARALTYDAVTDLVKALPYVPEEVFDENGKSLGIPNEPEFIIDENTGKKLYYLNMTLERTDGTLYDAKMVRGRVVSSSLSLSLPKDKSYAYIDISSFRGEKLCEEFRSALAEAKAAKRENLVIDLRDNGGGVMDISVEMANMLIAEEGRILYYTNSRKHETLTVTKSVGGGETFEKITVLVNQNTASAAELFAMILQYNCGALLVGTQTFGKAVGQESYGFQNGDMFTITTFELLDPTKKSYNAVGLTPDVEVTTTLKKAPFPEGLEIFNYINYKELSEGVTGDTVMGLERRLALMGYMREQYVDGVYDEDTTAAINAMRSSSHKEPTGMLDDKDVKHITEVVNMLKNYYYYYDAALDVAEMSFSSRSQAKRRAKELAKEHEITLREMEEFEKAEQERLLREEEEERLKAEAEAEASESVESETTKDTTPEAVPETADEAVPETTPETVVG